MAAAHVSAGDLFSALLTAAERACCIARACHHDELLKKLLVERPEEKKVKTKGGAEVRDFKTVADVLIQGTIEKEVTAKIPALKGRVYGEEEAHFSAPDKEYRVDIKPTECRDSTFRMLSLALNGNDEAGRRLADVVHSEVERPAFPAGAEDPYALSHMLDASRLGVWIDPLDGTSSFVAGKHGEANELGIITGGGLQTALVLIGVFDTESGAPVAGVVAQPFHVLNKDDGRWTGYMAWGLHVDGISKHGASVDLAAKAAGQPDSPPVVVHSKHESVANLKRCGDGVQTLAVNGAGYKLLAVVQGKASMFFLSMPTTYKWDTCGPHAILLAMGGTVTDTHGNALVYHTPDSGEEEHSSDDKWANRAGVVASQSADMHRAVCK